MSEDMSPYCSAHDEWLIMKLGGVYFLVTRFLPSENKVYTYIHTYIHTHDSSLAN